VCDPCAGERLPRQLRRKDVPYLGIQIVATGSERFRTGD